MIRGSSMDWRLFRLRRKSIPSTTKRARSAIAPMTPPAIAPTFMFVFDSERLGGGIVIVRFARLGYSSIISCGSLPECALLT